MKLKNISIALIVLTLTAAPLWAVTDAQLKQLAGQSDEPLAAAQCALYPAAFAHLIQQIDQAQGNAQRYARQIILQDICMHAARPGAEAQRLAMSKALAATLKDKSMTPEIRYWILLQIERTGAAEVLDTLTASLNAADSKEKNYAIAALEKNADPKATDILLTALANTKDDTLAAGLIYALGNRQAPEAVDALSKQLDSKNNVVATAAIEALAKINTSDSAAALKQKLTPTDPAAGTAAKGLLDIAAVSNPTRAAPLYNELYTWSGTVKPVSSVYNVRKAALIGLAANDAPGVDKRIIAEFKSDDAATQSMAIAAAAAAKSDRPANAMADNSGHLADTQLNQLIVMLADRNEASVMGPIRQAVKSSDPVLLQTVVDTLAQQETRIAASMLLELIKNSDGQTSRYARQNVVSTANANIDNLLQTAAATGDSKQRAEAIELLGERKTPGVTEQLLKYAQSDDDVIYKAAFKAIGLSAPADKIPALCDMAKTSTSGGFKSSALSAVNQVLRNAPDQKGAYAIILTEIKAAKGDLAIDLIGTLKMAGDADAMNYCLGLITDESFTQPVPQAALKALSSWSNSEPAKHFLDRAKTSMHKAEYAKAALDLAKNMLRYNKDSAKKIAKDVKKLNVSEAMNKNADKIISIR